MRRVATCFWFTTEPQSSIHICLNVARRFPTCRHLISYIYRQTIPHMSPNDFLLFSTYSWHQSAGGGKQFCLTAFETCYFWTIAKVPMKRVTFYWYLRAKTRNLLIYEGIWSWKHKNVCNFFNSCHTKLRLRLHKLSFSWNFGLFDAYISIMMSFGL